MSLDGNALQYNRLTVDNLAPPKNSNHKNDGIDQFLFTVFDSYAKEYSIYHQKIMAEFEEKLDALKKDIIYSNMTDKNATTGTNANVTMLTGIGDVS